MDRATVFPSGVEILGEITPRYAEILTPQALTFIARLHREFEARRQELLARRAARQDKTELHRQLRVVLVLL